MSFDLHFKPCRFDGTTETRINPFTRSPQEFPRNEPLSKAEVDAVLAVLRAAGATGPDADGCYRVTLSDGGNADIYGDDLGRGCMFAIRGRTSSPQLTQLLFDVLVAGHWVLVGVGDEDTVIAASAECAKSAPDHFGRVVVAGSPDDLSVLLSSGFSAWKRYRGAVIEP
jgi:hypothetical protein